MNFNYHSCRCLCTCVSLLDVLAVPSPLTYPRFTPHFRVTWWEATAAIVYGRCKLRFGQHHHAAIISLLRRVARFSDRCAPRAPLAQVLVSCTGLGPPARAKNIAQAGDFSGVKREGVKPRAQTAFSFFSMLSLPPFFARTPVRVCRQRSSRLVTSFCLARRFRPRRVRAHSNKKLARTRFDGRRRQVVCAAPKLLHGCSQQLGLLGSCGGHS